MCFELEGKNSEQKMDMKKHDQVHCICTVNVQKSAHHMYQQFGFGSDMSAVTARDLLVLGINVNIQMLFKAF